MDQVFCTTHTQHPHSRRATEVRTGREFETGEDWTSKGDPNLSSEQQDKAQNQEILVRHITLHRHSKNYAHGVRGVPTKQSINT